MPARRILSCVLIAFAVAACSGSPTSNPSAASPTPSPEDRSDQLPPGCDPIDLRGPDGQPVNLTGAWTGRQSWVGFFQSPTETTFIRQVGNCVWAAIMDEEFRSDPNYVGDFELPGGNLGTMRGQVTSDFVIEGELVSIRFGSPLAPAVFVQVRLLIEFDDGGGILLREDRTPGVGLRCYFFPQGEPFCPIPVILHRVDDLPAPAPSPT